MLTQNVILMAWYPKNKAVARIRASYLTPPNQVTIGKSNRKSGVEPLRQTDAKPWCLSGNSCSWPSFRRIGFLSFGLIWWRQRGSWWSGNTVPRRSLWRGHFSHAHHWVCNTGSNSLPIISNKLGWRRATTLGVTSDGGRDHRNLTGQLPPHLSWAAHNQ